MARKTGPVGNIVLIGFMGSGKTEVGRRLSSRIGRDFIDTDSLIESEGLPIPDIFAAEGETGFRRRERRAVARASRARRAVIATGGGAVLDADNVKALKKTGVLVYLQVGNDELIRRLEQTGGRPMLDSPEANAGTDPDAARSELARRRRRIRQLLAERLPAYESVADVVVPCEDHDVSGVTGEVLRRLDVGTGSKTVRVGFVDVQVDPTYRVHVGHGLLRRASATLPLPAGAEKACVVSHPRVYRLWGEALAEGLSGSGLEVTRITFPEGEDRKSLETAGRIYRRMAAASFHRSDIMLALGGGVVGDMTGFVASTYARGIPFFQIPTTLLAMVDAAIGGKTGFNLPEGKNLVGTFHQPVGVLSDLDVLRTLPERELRGGLSEVLKYALISDPSLGELVCGEVGAVFARDAVLEPIVLRSVEIKAGIVASDERERGKRAILNYGHTLGHALEALSLTGRLQGPRGTLHHGEAISIGMVFAAWASVVLGLAQKDLVDEHVRLLSAVGLPTTVGRVAWEDLARYVAVDKKYRGGLRMVLLESPGRAVVLGEIPQTALREALSRVVEA